MSKLSAKRPHPPRVVNKPSASLGSQMILANVSGLTGLPADLPCKPSSALKKEGWSGFMHEVKSRGALVVTHRNQPEAIVLSVDKYEALSRLAERQKILEAQQLAELNARFDQRLVVLKTPQGRQALDAFMEEPVLLDGQVRAGTSC